MTARRAACVALLLACGCASREHMSDDYGQKTRAFFGKQHVYARAESGSPAGLDSEEAALIQGTYRRNLGGAAAGQAARDPSSRVLLLQESDRDARKDR